MENEKVKYKWFRDAINWISTSFQNSRGKVCSKRTTVFAFVTFIGYICILHLNDPNSIPIISILSGAVISILGVKDYFEGKNKKEEQ